MDYMVARCPIFNRRREIFGYELLLCQSLIDHYNLYNDASDADQLYRLLCFADHTESPVQPAALMALSEDAPENQIPLFPKENFIIKCGSSDNINLLTERFLNLKAQKYRLAFDASENTSPELASLADILRIDYAAMSLDAQLRCMEGIWEARSNRIENVTDKIKFLAFNVETWEDYEKAYAIGFDYFQGSFFLKPHPAKRSDIRSLNTTILRVIAELGRQEPTLKEIANIIEHDVNLSYGLLKLVNSAYIAPKFKIKTIPQAVTMLGLNELNTFMSTMILKEAQSPENTELLRCSLVRGKLVELLADRKYMHKKGSEAFFTGMFSLIDIILNKNMEDIISELPLTNTVKDALTGKNNNLKTLLDTAVAYEQAEWSSVNTLDAAGQEEFLNLYIAALTWAESLDF